MPKFKITREDVEVLRITVLEGRGISVGWSDALDTPDPYVKLRVSNSPNGKQRTQAIANNKNPKWDKELLFYLDPEKERILAIKVMDDDYGFDDIVGNGEHTYDLRQLKVGETVHHTFHFGGKTFVDVKMVIEINTTHQLRYGHDLCEEEKNFRDSRKEKVLQALQKLLPHDQAPKDVNEVPMITVMGSGGGFRAMAGLAGVFTALESHNVLACTTYTAGLSGSSWYISTLVAHPLWPNYCCDVVAKEIKNRIDESFTHLLTPPHLAKYFQYINKKRCLGYPVSFTDFFGCLVGDTLLKDNKFKLTYARKNVCNGLAPLPLCTAVQVEKGVSAQVFCEWMEFTPFEVGSWRYGVFLKTEHFGGKFYKGRLIRENHEQYLHYLQGMWGSAFTILFSRLLQPSETHSKDDGKAALNEFCSSDELKHKNEDSDSDDEVETDDEDNEHHGSHSEEAENPGVLSTIGHALASPFIWIYRAITGEPKPIQPKKGANHRTKANDEPFWKDWLNDIINSSSVLSTREGRAAEIHNIFRGLKMENAHEGDNDRIVSSQVKNTFFVDGGLSFNSPYPSILRPQRAVNLILSFDFSQREHDNTQPFEELLLAEEWARENNQPFPPVKDNPIIRDPDNIKELYIFEDKTDPKCPIIMHFVLINKTFREYKAPGVPRETEEEKEFGNFDIFDDPQQPYSSFKFDYTHKEFDRLYELTKFNTLLHMDEIKEKILQAVKTCQNNAAL